MLIRTSRRRFLGGLSLGAGGALLLPMARHLVRPVMAQDGPDRRIVLVTVSEGVKEEHTPVVAPGGGVDVNAFASLEPYADQVTWVHEMYNPYNKQLHSNWWPLCVAPGMGTDGKDAPGGISFDRALAGTLGAGTPVSSVSLAPYGGNNNQKDSNSADGPNAQFHLIRSATEAFDTLFGSLVGDEAGDFEQRLARDVSLMDFVAQDAAAVANRLAGPEREQLEQYLDSLAAIEAKLEGLAALSCGAPELPEVPDEDYEALRLAMFELTVLAMACGITRVIRHEWKRDNRPHSWWHGEGTDADFRGWHDSHAGYLVELWESFSAIPHGAGTMADETLLMFLPTNGKTHHGGMFDKQALLMGSAGGTLKTGHVVDLPRSPIAADDPRIEEEDSVDDEDSAPDRCIVDLFTTVAHAMGVDMPTFGPEHHNRGMLEELLA